MLYLKKKLKTNKGTISYLYVRCHRQFDYRQYKEHEQNMFLKDGKKKKTLEEDHFRIGFVLGGGYIFYILRFVECSYMLFINVISLIEHEIILKIY